MPLTINGQIVDPALIEQEFSNIKSYYERMSQVSCCERDSEFLGYAKDNITARVLLNQDAEKNGSLPSNAEVEAAIANLKEEHGGEEQFYYKAGITPEQEDLVRKDVAASLRVDNHLATLLGPEPSPTEEELRAFYTKNIDEFMTEEEVSACHLFKSLSQTNDRQALYDSLREIRKRAVAGENFEALAREHTDKEEKDVDLGYFKQGELSDEFEVIAFSLEVGDVTPVFSSHWGFHLAKITGRKPAEPHPFEDVRDDVRALYIADDRQKKTQMIVDQLKAAATIVDEEEA
ncbi:MAG: peptidyl-prolyl cis-trans isomerase [Verrucomicrobiae bacterium]|nr:peptidyl-prolyl cis-trans isomerase [Verrucomicrobiae bacterium]